MNKRVIIVDTSNEIAGDGDIPHPAIGSARRMQVARPAGAARRDDRGGREPHAGGHRHRRDRHRARGPGGAHHRRARRAARRHGPRQHAREPDGEPDALRPGRRHPVGDPRATRRRAGAARRSRSSSARRRRPSTSVVEIQNWDRVAIHSDVAETVDSILRGYRISPEVRELADDGDVRRLSAEELAQVARRRKLERSRAYTPSWDGPAPVPIASRRKEQQKAQRIYPFGISRKRLTAGDEGDRLRRLHRRAARRLGRRAHRPQLLPPQRRSRCVRRRRAASRFSCSRATRYCRCSRRCSRWPKVAAPTPCSNAMTEAEEAIQTVMLAGPAGGADAAARLYPPPAARAGPALQPQLAAAWAASPSAACASSPARATRTPSSAKSRTESGQPAGRQAGLSARVGIGRAAAGLLRCLL